MTKTPTTREIRLTQRIRAPLDRVWRACADPRGIAAWQADEAFGEVAPGGRLALRWPALEVMLDLTVVEVEPRVRIVLGAGDARLTLELDGGNVRLHHSGLSEGDELDGVASSWRMSLGLLAHYCERHPDGERDVTWMIEGAPAGSETAHVFFTDEVALGAWLGNGTSIGEPGSSYRLELPGGERMSGRVLANTPGRDVALSWEEDGDSAVCLRTLPRPNRPNERLVAFAWSRWNSGPPPADRAEGLATAHRRLTRALGNAPSA